MNTIYSCDKIFIIVLHELFHQKSRLILQQYHGKEVADKKLPQKGVLQQEELDFSTFLETQNGQLFKG